MEKKGIDPLTSRMRKRALYLPSAGFMKFKRKSSQK